MFMRLEYPLRDRITHQSLWSHITDTARIPLKRIGTLYIHATLVMQALGVIMTLDPSGWTFLSRFLSALVSSFFPEASNIRGFLLPAALPTQTVLIKYLLSSILFSWLFLLASPITFVITSLTMTPVSPGFNVKWALALWYYSVESFRCFNSSQVNWTTIYY